MTNFNNLCPIEAVFLEYDFQPFARMVDVGGGLGAFAAAALASAPALRGHLFDLPNVVQQAQEVRLTGSGGSDGGGGGGAVLRVLGVVRSRWPFPPLSFAYKCYYCVDMCCANKNNTGVV